METFTISQKLQFSQEFTGIVAERCGEFSDWTDGSYDWADQTNDFLHSETRMPKKGPWVNSKKAREMAAEAKMIYKAMLENQFAAVRECLKGYHFLFIVGFPRSGGSYLTKEALRTVGLDHTKVSENLAHDGFPSTSTGKMIWERGPLLQMAEFLVAARHFFGDNTQPGPDGEILIPKKAPWMNTSGWLYRTILDQTKTEYWLTIRHPLPLAISIAEKSGSLTGEKEVPERFPTQTRSSIERQVAMACIRQGVNPTNLTYFDAVSLAWAAYHLQMVGVSGLFHGQWRGRVRFAPYSKETMEAGIKRLAQMRGAEREPEPFFIHQKAREVAPEIRERLEIKVRQVAAAWGALGVPFPKLELL